MRELPMMGQVKDLSSEIVLAVIFHYITGLVRRAEVAQRVGKMYLFHDIRLPGDVASCLALPFGPIRRTSRNRRTIVGQHECFEIMLHLWRAICKTARPMPRSASSMYALDEHAPRQSLQFWPSC